MSYRFGVFPSVLLATMPLADFQLLVAAERLEPRGERRDDLRAGIVAAAMANFNAFRGRGGRAARPSDFMPDFGPQRKTQDPREAKAQILRWVMAKGGQVIEAGKG